MKPSINKHTKIYCSFAKNAGNKGCVFFNTAFDRYNIDAIYKSFSVSNLEDALQAAITLQFSGCAIAMPFKKIAFDLIHNRDISAIQSHAINTIIFDWDNGTTIGYNTDYYAAYRMLAPYRAIHNHIYILGNGGLASAVSAQAIQLGYDIVTITRDNWSRIDNLTDSLIFNCTPVSPSVNISNTYIDCLIGTVTGDLFNYYQATKQFSLYTGREYDI